MVPWLAPCHAQWHFLHPREISSLEPQSCLSMQRELGTWSPLGTALEP